MLPIILSLGSNLGNRLDNLTDAISILSGDIDILSISPVYETQPLYITQQPLFLNLVLHAKTKLSATSLLSLVKQIEIYIGRKPSVRFGPRAIDIDIIDFDSQQIKTNELTTPHPRLKERLFVLKPLLDISPKWVHPYTKQTLEDLIKQLPDKKSVKVFGNIAAQKNTQ